MTVTNGTDRTLLIRPQPDDMRLIDGILESIASAWGYNRAVVSTVERADKTIAWITVTLNMYHVDGFRLNAELRGLAVSYA